MARPRSPWPRAIAAREERTPVATTAIRARISAEKIAETTTVTAGTVKTWNEMSRPKIGSFCPNDTASVAASSVSRSAARRPPMARVRISVSPPQPANTSAQGTAPVRRAPRRPPASSHSSTASRRAVQASSTSSDASSPGCGPGGGGRRPRAEPPVPRISRGAEIAAASTKPTIHSPIIVSQRFVNAEPMPSAS